MKLTYFRGAVPNFGDELNVVLWDQILPRDFLDDDPSELFLGIGSILWDHLPRQPRKFVVGSGYGGYTAPPDVHDGAWDVVFVRGPRTAALLGLDSRKAICDSAVLIRLLDLPRPPRTSGVAFMPHFGSLDRGAWAEVCRLADIRFIDPTKPVLEIISDILATNLLITEAMHGAIVADALRTPWIGVQPIAPENHMKWLDWSEALGVVLRHHPLRPSTILEQYVRMTAGKAYYDGRARRWAQNALAAPLRRVFLHRAAARLRQLSQIEPQLSADTTIASVTERAAAAVDGFVRSRDQHRAAAG